jgi:signal transduction histidine kinase
MTGRWRLAAGIAVVGVAAGAVVAAAGGLGGSDTIRLLLYSTTGAGVAGVAAVGLMHLLRRSPIGVQAAVAALTPVVAVGLGVAWASQQMFLMSHDLWILWVVLLDAGSVALITSMLLGQRIATASRSVSDMARRLGELGPGSPLGHGVTGGAPGELAALASQLERTSARLAEAQAQTAAAERSRRELVAWVSHDLRTPLAGIRAMVEALEDGIVDDPDTVQRYHGTMRREADRLASLVDDLFELSRIQAGSLSLAFEAVPIDELVSDAIAGVAFAAGAKEIALRSDVCQPPPVVELSTPEMARVVSNLLDNAIRHTPPGGTVLVEARLDPPGSGAEVSVQDGCGGIPEQDLDLVFDLAFRGDAARTPGDGGGGLGLAVARGLVEAHHGQINVHNEGPGCRFTVLLPLRRS